jgi:hypothetical protein
LNLNQREHCLGLSYVATSRVRALDKVLFEAPFDFERFRHVNSYSWLGWPIREYELFAVGPEHQPFLLKETSQQQEKDCG